MLTPQQLKERALNKIDSKLFFAVKDLQRNELEMDGVIPTKMSYDDLNNVKFSYECEVDVLRFIKTAIESYKETEIDESQINLEDLINEMTKR